MANYTQIRAGAATPAIGDLQEFQLGYCTGDGLLYIGVPQSGSVVPLAVGSKMSTVINANSTDETAATSKAVYDYALATSQTIYTDMNELVGHRLEIISTSDILSDAIQTTTLTARVWHGSQDVTTTIPAQRFKWKRVSADSTADNLWNAAHTGLKSITLTVLDVQYSATYSCELTDE